MKRARTLALILFFLGLAVLEIAHGLFRLNAVRERQRHRLLERIERGYRDLAAEVRGALADKREHAAYLAAAPDVRGLLDAPDDPERRRRLESRLLPYLLAFRGIDRIRVLDNAGREVFRCERIGGAAGVLPRALLADEPDTSMLDLVADLRPGQVAVSPMSIDRERVEVPESDRQVLHYAAKISGDQERLGVLVLTVYARPLLDAVRRFAPVKGVFAVLVDSQGRYLKSDGAEETLGNVFEDNPRAASRLLSGAERVETDELAYLGSSVHREPHWILVCRIPEHALREASGDLRGDYAWIIGSTVILTAVLAIAAGVLARMSIREFRLRERSTYLEAQKELERRLQISEKLGSLGLLTAGVAHEINNPLEGIGNYLALLDRDSIPEEKRQSYIGLIRHGFDRIRDIVSDLASFTRSKSSGGSADVTRVVQRALSMVRYSRRFSGTGVTLEGLDEPLWVSGEAGRLEQVFINLLLNAAKATRGEGHVVVSAHEIDGSRAETDGTDGTDGADGAGEADEAGEAVESESTSWVEIRVDDNGPGIPEEDLARIFDPFFTREHSDEGGNSLGLGLFISYGIIDAHGGALRAENREEGGARFIVRLPAEREPSAVAAHAGVEHRRSSIAGD